MGATTEDEAVELCTYSLKSFSAIVYGTNWRTKVDMFNSRYFISPTLGIMDLRSMVILADGSTPVTVCRRKDKSLHRWVVGKWTTGCAEKTE